MTQCRHCEIDATSRFRKGRLYVCCKSDGLSTDRVRQLHDLLPSPTDMMLSPVSRALRARSFQGTRPNRMSAVDEALSVRSISRCQ
ncbi:unnamed protein product [Peronospora belbahrii]|uniref:Uncharacterized protein n=1 Tax=Peronospora belbahrii TaxID=622444 RepID=A0AAU9L3K8_9STRA|nr:unnamed protein product [Peronospora belbahrii]CAH0517133.1 unnamed protein product [Peronospora belbahrii]